MTDRSGTTDFSGASSHGRLALALQEAFTVAVRLRVNRHAAGDAGTFRAHVKQLLTAADREARGHGIDAESVRLAVYAYIAFLDESVLTASQPMFSAWSQQPLQEEVFGDHVAGENFFRHLAELLARPDSAELADLLEVFQLCILLGFRGKYAANPAGLQSIVGMIEDKIRRIRGSAPPLAPSWAPPDGEHVAVPRDPWVRRLAIASGAGLAVAVLVWLGFGFFLGDGVAELRALSTSLIR